MSRGPLPTGQARRRNAPTIPSTTLPASGRADPAPDPPASYELRDAGMAWWVWAWSLPQAAAWDDGSLYIVARRAQLEDDLAALEHIDHFDLAELLGLDEEHEQLRTLQWMIGGLKRLATGSVSVMKEMDALDDRLGLSPKALAALRWKIVDDEAKPEAPLVESAKVRRLRPIDPQAAAS